MLFLSYSVVSLSAQQVDVARYVDWPKRHFVFVLSTAVDPAGLPSSKQRAEGLIERRKVSAISENLASLYLDDLGPFSLPTGIKRTNLSLSLNIAVTAAAKDYVTFSSNMRSVQVTYILDFSALTGIIARSGYSHIQPLLLPNKPFEYTGIVIDATEILPIKGSQPDTILLNPALLPSLNAADGRDLVTPSSVSESFFRKWGTIGYSFSLNDRDWPVDRVGRNPLVIPAQGILGINHTSVEIADQYADWILSSEKGRQFLLEGKVIFLIKDQQQVIARLN
ncbi:MAG: hypothetical protein ACRCVN_06720 [Spirochaetia bacterium]